MKHPLYLSVLLLLAMASAAQQPPKMVLTGTVIDSATHEPISGASIRIEGTTSGTYTRSGGRFRLPIPGLAKLLRVRSVGYHERLIAVDQRQDAMTIALPASSIALAGVRVLGDITPEEIIRRSIERKKENATRISSIVSTLYSKMKYKIDMGGLGSQGDGPKESITETFSKVYDRRSPDPKKHLRITQRRQTANVGAQSNLAVFDDFFDFTQDELTILKTTMITPLGADALDEYEYRLLWKKPLGGQMVYELAFAPKARVFPGFEGTLTIVEGTYQVIAASFSPTDETAFPFLKDLTYEQRYEKVNDSVWAPSYQNVTAGVKVRIITGLLEITADVAAQTYVTDIAVNTPIDDSLFIAPEIAPPTAEADSGGATVRIEKQNSAVTVDPGADSFRPEFWNEHSFSEQSAEDSLLYHRQDSAIAAGGGREKDSARRANADRESSTGGGGSIINLPQIGNLSIGLNPLLNRSSITGMLYGGTIKAALSPVTLTSSVAFGEKGTKVGSAELGISIIKNNSLQLTLFGGVMSAIATVQESKTIIKRLGFLNLSNLLFRDNFDFFRRDGFEAGATIKTKDVRLALSGSWTRHINMPLIETVNRVTIRADAGDYQVLQLSGTFFEPGLIESVMGKTSPVTMRVNALAGRETQSNRQFLSLDIAIDGRIPTFTTGYVPMGLDVTLSAGIQSTQTPVQGRFNVARRFPFLGSTRDFSTVGINNFAGTEYLSVVSEHNFSDMLWRLVGLPTFSSGRGIDFIGRFAAMNITQRAQPVVAGLIFDSTPGIYMEAGFAIGRIPTFISDLFFLRFDALWPVGPLSPRGTFGWAITISSPLL